MGPGERKGRPMASAGSRQASVVKFTVPFPALRDFSSLLQGLGICPGGGFRDMRWLQRHEGGSAPPRQAQEKLGSAFCDEKALLTPGM